MNGVFKEIRKKGKIGIVGDKKRKEGLIIKKVMEEERKKKRKIIIDVWKICIEWRIEIWEGKEEKFKSILKKENSLDVEVKNVEILIKRVDEGEKRGINNDERIMKRNFRWDLEIKRMDSVVGMREWEKKENGGKEIKRIECKLKGFESIVDGRLEWL